MRLLYLYTVMISFYCILSWQEELSAEKRKLADYFESGPGSKSPPTSLYFQAMGRRYMYMNISIQEYIYIRSYDFVVTIIDSLVRKTLKMTCIYSLTQSGKLFSSLWTSPWDKGIHYCSKLINFWYIFYHFLDTYNVIICCFVDSASMKICLVWGSGSPLMPSSKSTQRPLRCSTQQSRNWLRQNTETRHIWSVAAG